MGKQGINNKIIKSAVIENIALWLNVTPAEVEKHLNDFSKIERLNNILDTEVISYSEAVARRIFHRILLISSEPVRYMITDILKKFRQLVRKDLIEVEHCVFVALYHDLLKKMRLEPFNWKGQKGAICLCHDIDSKECYDFIPEVLDLESRYNFRSTFNLLTGWSYKVDKKLVKDIDARGFEVGLHGWTHDIALGARPRARIKSELQRALDDLSFKVIGFRAPAFSVTKTLLEVLSELGIKYDGSMKTLSCYGQGVETCYPYKFPDVDIWEIPLTVQDDRIFRDLHLSCEEGVGVIKELSKRIVDVNGVVVINTHLRLIKRKPKFYKDLLLWLDEYRNNAMISPMRDVYYIFEERFKKLKNEVKK